MKYVLITLFISLAGTISSFAQCNEKAMLFTTKTSLADISGNHLGIKEEKTLLRFSKEKILLNIDEQDRGELKILSHTCNWTVPYKEGKSVIKAAMNNSDYTISIEGKEGKVSMRVVKEDSDDSILSMVADKFEKID